ncbi:hypothetical protein ACAW74_03250 [Fibrella sp. WM1]|uniref:hypothetical protein n=1 Tax=Fibrella musci TaxID=3242485 RepID=UPI003522E165
MNTAPSATVADMYFGFLRHLSADSKRALITRLSQSVKQTGLAQPVPLNSLFGALKSDQSADDLIADIREARVSNRIVESF